MNTQPFQGNDMLVIEKRDNNGKLSFADPQPPAGYVTFDEVYNMYFAADPGGSGDWDSLRKWLSNKGWTLRKKTW